MFHFWAVVNSADKNSCTRLYVDLMCSGLLGIPLSGGVAGSHATVFNISMNCQAVFQAGGNRLRPTSKAQVFQFLHILTGTCYHHFYFSLPNGREVVSNCGSDLHFSEDCRC